MNANYIEEFNRYSYVVTHLIEKCYPEYIDDEDLKQDLYLELLEYIKCNEAYYNVSNSKKVTYIHRQMKHKLDRLIKLKSRKEIQEIVTDKSLKFIYHEPLENLFFKQDLKKAMQHLTTYEKHVLDEYYYNDRTLRDIGSDSGRSFASVRLKWKRGLRKLRHPLRAKFIKDYYFSQ